MSERLYPIIIFFAVVLPTVVTLFGIWYIFGLEGTEAFKCLLSK